MNIGVKVVLPFLPENKADILLPTEKTSGAYPPYRKTKIPLHTTKQTFTIKSRSIGRACGGRCF